MKPASETYKRLYHYTTAQGIYGILQTQSIWGTHYKFLNDYSEIVLFKPKLIESLYPYISSEFKEMMKRFPNAEQLIDTKGGFEAIVRRDTESLVKSNYDALGHEIYITSFCGEHSENEYINEHGLLSQWRGYGQSGGFALVFNTQKLEQMLHREAEIYSYSTGFIADLVYSDDEEKLKAELFEPLSHTIEYARTVFTHVNLQKEEPPDAAKAFPAFVQCISRYKHRGFKEENEVRIVALPIVHNEKYLQAAKNIGQKLLPEKKRKLRDKNGEQIPYIELFGWPDHPLPIERIIVGPHKEKEARAAELRSMLQNTDIDISVSDIPYVG